MGAQLGSDNSGSGGSKEVDPALLQNLDLMSNMDLMKREADWGALENIPDKAFENSDAFEKNLDKVKEDGEKNGENK